jgi:diacylglycerol kinase family enzyme
MAARPGHVAGNVRPPAQRRVAVVINTRSGSETLGKDEIARRVEESLSARGMEVDVELAHTDTELIAACGRAATGRADTVVAAGGDGTIAAVAATLVNTNKLLGVLPLGTFNYFARALGGPLELEEAVDVVAAGVPQPADIGEVNGRIFLNNSSLGLYPTVLQHREAAYRKLGRSRWASYLSVAFALAQPPSLMRIHLAMDGVPFPRRTPLVFVGMNADQLDSFSIPGKTCLDSHRLAVCVIRPLRLLELWRLGIRAFVHGLDGSSELEVVCARELQITMRPKRVRVALDGEIVILQTPLHYRLRAAAFRVLVRGAHSDGRPQ